MRRIALSIAVATGCALPFPAIAHEFAAAQPSTIEVTSIRDPGVMSYGDVEKIRNLFKDNEISRSIRPGFRIVSRGSGTPIEGLEVRLYADAITIPVPLNSGYVALHDLPVTDDPEAEFLSNQRKGSLHMQLVLGVVTKERSRFTGMELANALEDANTVRNTILPWYWRLLLPKFSGVVVCFSAPGGAVETGNTTSHKMITARGVDGCLELKQDELHPDKVFIANREPLFIGVH